MRILYIENKSEVSGAVATIRITPVVGLDTETTGYTPRDGEISLLQIAVDPETVFVFNVLKLLDQGEDFTFLDNLLQSDQVVVIMNAKFDLQFIQKLLGRRLRVRNLMDVMLASILLAFGDKSQRHSLAKIVGRELGETLEKDLQKSDFSGPEFSQSQIEYAAADAAIVLRIREKQLEKIEKDNLRWAAKIEFNAVVTLAEMEYRGIYIEPTIWQDRIRSQADRYTELEDEILSDIGPRWPVQTLWGTPSINLCSPHQVLQFLNDIGLDMEGTSEYELKVMQNADPIIPKLLAFREVETAKKKFGEGYNRFFSPVTGRVHAEFWQIEAPTGRMSARNPNLMQIPKHGGYRDAFRCQDEGGRMITADYSQVELRIMARRSGDRVMTRAFINDEDLHNVTAHEVLGQPLVNPDPEVRIIAKNLNFGTAYGTSPATFAKLAKISVREAEKKLKHYWKVYAGLDRYLTEQGEIAVRTAIMRTASGRTGKLKLDMQDPKLRGRARRLGRNFSIQGTGADILKTALYEVRNAFLDAGLHDAYIVNCLHDEIVTDAPSDAEQVAYVQEQAMNKAAAKFLDPVPSKVDIRIADSWIK